MLVSTSQNKNKESAARTQQLAISQSRCTKSDSPLASVSKLGNLTNSQTLCSATYLATGPTNVLLHLECRRNRSR